VFIGFTSWCLCHATLHAEFWKTDTWMCRYRGVWWKVDQCCEMIFSLFLHKSQSQTVAPVDSEGRKFFLHIEIDAYSGTDCLKTGNSAVLNYSEHPSFGEEHHVGIY
jgi:hypothetical protein